MPVLALPELHNISILITSDLSPMMHVGCGLLSCLAHGTMAHDYHQNYNKILCTTVPPVADIVCSAGSLLQCHVRRHCHAKIKAKIGCYAILHATFADYIRLNISHHILLFDSEKWMNK